MAFSNTHRQHYGTQYEFANLCNPTLAKQCGYTGHKDKGMQPFEIDSGGITQVNCEVLSYLTLPSLLTTKQVQLSSNFIHGTTATWQNGFKRLNVIYSACIQGFYLYFVHKLLHF